MTAPASIIRFVPGATITRYSPQKAAEPQVFDMNQLLILDPRAPMTIARQFVADKYTADGQPTLYRYRDEFFKFSGSSYRAADGETIRAEIYSYLEGAYTKNADTCSLFRPKKGVVDNVIDALQAVCNLESTVETPTWLDGAGEQPPATEFLPVANGLLHLPSCKMQRPSPLYFGLGSSEIAYDPAAPEPRAWLKFLHEVFDGDLASIELLQEMMGYLLSQDTTLQKILMLVGPPRSGKGTISSVLKVLVGPSKVAGPTMASLGQNFGLAPLIGKSVAIVGDARISGRTDQAVITERLLSISGEDTHTIDRKYKKQWTGQLGTRFLIMTNELPRLTDNSGALANRFVILVTQQSFLSREDHGLQARMENEYPGILNWALEGQKRLRQRGHFLPAPSSREAIQELGELASPIKAFVSDKCNVSGEVPCSRLFAAYQSWCSENGHRASSIGVFGRDLRAAFPAIKTSQPRNGDTRKRRYVGVSLKPECAE